MSEAERIWRALEVPEAARVDRRVPKARLIEGAGIVPADRRLVEEGVERIDWRATLRPGSTGIPAGTDPEAPCAEIVVILATLRSGARGARLAEVLHRAVTAPLVLLLDGEEGGRLSVGLKRAHEREEGRLVLDRLATSPPLLGDGPLDGPADPIDAAFMTSLALPRVPAADLPAFHEALAVRAETLAAAREVGAFRLPRDGAEAQARRAALGRVVAERTEVDRLRREARRSKSLARRVALSHEVRAAEAVLRSTLDDLL